MSGVPRPSRSEGWGTDRSRVSSPSPTLVFDKDGTPTLNGGAVTNVLNYCLGLGPYCGDGCCNVDEDCTTCPQDCDDCGNGCCTHDETYQQCPADCEFIPATFTWGLIVLTLLTLTTGTLILRSARTPTL